MRNYLVLIYFTREEFEYPEYKRVLVQGVESALEAERKAKAFIAQNYEAVTGYSCHTTLVDHLMLVPAEKGD